MWPYIRTVVTASGAGRCGSCTPPAQAWDIERIGSAHDDAELELLKAAARQRLVSGQDGLKDASRPTTEL